MTKYLFAIDMVLLMMELAMIIGLLNGNEFCQDVVCAMVGVMSQ